MEGHFGNCDESRYYILEEKKVKCLRAGKESEGASLKCAKDDMLITHTRAVSACSTGV